MGLGTHVANGGGVVGRPYSHPYIHPSIPIWIWYAQESVWCEEVHLWGGLLLHWLPACLPARLVRWSHFTLYDQTQYNNYKPRLWLQQQLSSDSVFGNVSQRLCLPQQRTASGINYLWNREGESDIEYMWENLRALNERHQFVGYGTRPGLSHYQMLLALETTVTSGTLPLRVHRSG